MRKISHLNSNVLVANDSNLCFFSFNSRIILLFSLGFVTTFSGWLALSKGGIVGMTWTPYAPFISIFFLSVKKKLH